MRAYLFSKRDGLRHNTYEWTAEGVEAELPKLQNINPSGFGWFVGKLEQRLPLCIEYVRSLRDATVRDMLTAQGIRSLLAAPLPHEGRLQGMFGFDICNRRVT